MYIYIYRVLGLEKASIIHGTNRCMNILLYNNKVSWVIYHIPRIVGTPSATSFIEAVMESSVSPLPIRTPTVRLRDAGPKHVNIKSPRARIKENK